MDKLIRCVSCIGGDLHSYVTRKDRVDSSEALFITYQLLLSLEVSFRSLSRSYVFQA